MSRLWTAVTDVQKWSFMVSVWHISWSSCSQLIKTNANHVQNCKQGGALWHQPSWFCLLMSSNLDSSHFIAHLSPFNTRNKSFRSTEVFVPSPSTALSSFAPFSPHPPHSHFLRPPYLHGPFQICSPPVHQMTSDFSTCLQFPPVREKPLFSWLSPVIWHSTPTCSPVFYSSIILPSSYAAFNGTLEVGYYRLPTWKSRTEQPLNLVLPPFEISGL